jgi:hypothetical protein
MSSRRGEGGPAQTSTPANDLLPSLVSLGVGTGMDYYYDYVDENVKNDLRETRLHRNCQYGETDRVAFLLKTGWNRSVNELDKSKRAPLHYACESGSADCAALLLEAGADANMRSGRGRTPLHCACMHGKVECVRLLLKHGADADARDQHGSPPLHSACWRGYPECTRLLLEAGADANARDADGDTPEDCAWGGTGDVDSRFACARLVRRAIVLRKERGVAVGAPLPLDWTESTHALLAGAGRRLLNRALGALLLVDARREGGATLGREGALAFVAGLARVAGM